MALITPALDVTLPVPRVLWSAVDAASTFNPWIMRAQYGLAGAIQISGTFGGATVALQASNDGVTYFPVLNLQGSPVSATANGLFEFTCSAVYLRPAITGGTGTALTAAMVLRGSSDAD